MKHIERPIFPRHNQSALTLIVVQKTKNHRLYFTVFRSVESNMEIWKLQCKSALGCCDQNTAPQKPTLPTFLKHQKFAIQSKSCLTHMDNFAVVASAAGGKDFEQKITKYFCGISLTHICSGRERGGRWQLSKSQHFEQTLFPPKTFDIQQSCLTHMAWSAVVWIVAGGVSPSVVLW